MGFSFLSSPSFEFHSHPKAFINLYEANQMLFLFFHVFIVIIFWFLTSFSSGFALLKSNFLNLLRFTKHLHHRHHCFLILVLQELHFFFILIVFIIFHFIISIYREYPELVLLSSKVYYCLYLKSLFFMHCSANRRVESV